MTTKLVRDKIPEISAANGHTLSSGSWTRPTTFRRCWPSCARRRLNSLQSSGRTISSPSWPISRKSRTPWPRPPDPPPIEVAEAAWESGSAAAGSGSGSSWSPLVRPDRPGPIQSQESRSTLLAPHDEVSVLHRCLREEPRAAKRLREQYNVGLVWGVCAGTIIVVNRKSEVPVAVYRLI